MYGIFKIIIPEKQIIHPNLLLQFAVKCFLTSQYLFTIFTSFSTLHMYFIHIVPNFQNHGHISLLPERFPLFL